MSWASLACRSSLKGVRHLFQAGRRLRSQKALVPHEPACQRERKPASKTPHKRKAPSLTQVEEAEVTNVLLPVEDRVYWGDCLQGMKRMASGSVDLVVTDPPFGIDFKSTKSAYARDPKRVLTGYREVLGEDYYSFSLGWLEEVHRLLKDNGSVYVFSGFNNLRQLLSALKTAGFETVNHLVWNYNFGVFTTKKMVCAHYHVLHVCKAGQRATLTFENTDRSSAWSVPREYWAGQDRTPTKLPGALVEKIIARSSRPGDVVLDPFLGSGQVALVARDMKRHFSGFELVREYYDFIQTRLAQ